MTSGAPGIVAQPQSLTVAGAPDYSAAAGDTVTVSVYLQETLTDGSQSLISSNGGLGVGGFSVTRDGATPNNATPSSLTGIDGNGSPLQGGFLVGSQTSSFQSGTDNESPNQFPSNAPSLIILA